MTHRAFVVDGSEIDRLRFAVVGVDDCHSGFAQRSVDREHAHCPNVKIERRSFNTESTNSKTTVLLARLSKGHRDGSDHDLMGYIVFAYTFHVWGDKRDVAPVATHGSGIK